jgi:electron transport complex protein RnfG
MRRETSGARGYSVLRVQAVLVAIALVAGLAIATVHELTRPLVMAQRGGLLGEAALEVLPGAVSYRIYARGPAGHAEPLRGDEEAALFVGLDAGGEPVGVAIVASGMGYQDTIRLVYGLDFPDGRLLGMRVVASRETPGLGARIVDDADFVQGFASVVLQFDEEGAVQSLTVSEEARHEVGEIDAITGATVSTEAVARIISDSLRDWLPALRAQYEDLMGNARG